MLRAFQSQRRWTTMRRLETVSKILINQRKNDSRNRIHGINTCTKKSCFAYQMLFFMPWNDHSQYILCYSNLLFLLCPVRIEGMLMGKRINEVQWKKFFPSSYCQFVTKVNWILLDEMLPSISCECRDFISHLLHCK